MLERAKEIIENLKKGGRINSQEFTVVYNAVVGENYVYENCGPCFKKAVLKLSMAIEKKSQIVEPVQNEVIEEPIKQPTSKKSNKK